MKTSKISAIFLGVSIVLMVFSATCWIAGFGTPTIQSFNTGLSIGLIFSGCRIPTLMKINKS